MKKIQFEIRVDEESGKIATAWKTEGYSRESISDNLELIGILENTKGLIQDNLKILASKRL